MVLRLPLPWLLGPLCFTATLAIAGIRPFGHDAGAPNWLRSLFAPIIGVAIGGAFSPGIFAELIHWWPTVLALVVYMPLAHISGFLIAHRIMGFDPNTAYFGTMPGGFIEAGLMAERANADQALVATLQFLRLTSCIVLVPIGFSLATGHTVGSGAGVALADANAGLAPREWIILGIAAGLGYWTAKALKIPAYAIVGPLAFSGAAHLAGWVTGGPPDWLIAATQVVIGVNFGGRFAGRSPKLLLTGARSTLMTLPVAFALSALFALSLAGLVGQTWQAVFLAFTPGGLVEMALIALSLNIGIVYVTMHHIIRIMLAVTLAQSMHRWVVKAPRS